MTVKLLTEHHLEFLRSIGSCTGSSESTLVKKAHYWKLHVTAHFCIGSCFVMQYLMSFLVLKKKSLRKRELMINYAATNVVF